MATEIERRWFVNVEEFKQLHDVTMLPKQEIIQGYLSVDPDRTMRIRVINQQQAFITIKSRKQGLSCKEFEYPIPVEDAEEMLPMCVGQVHKCRLFVAHVENTGTHVFEVDFFSDLNDGLVLAELELESENIVLDNPPVWLEHEITSDANMQIRLSNSVLAMKPVFLKYNHMGSTYSFIKHCVLQDQFMASRKATI
jgi:CYTH domain-containing protein